MRARLGVCAAGGRWPDGPVITSPPAWADVGAPLAPSRVPPRARTPPHVPRAGADRAQTQMKQRLAAAHRGHSLLKKKADALTVRFRAILKEIVQNKVRMGEVMKAAFFSLAEAKFAAGSDFGQMILENAGKARVRVQCERENIAE